MPAVTFSFSFYLFHVQLKLVVIVHTFSPFIPNELRYSSYDNTTPLACRTLWLKEEVKINKYHQILSTLGHDQEEQTTYGSRVRGLSMRRRIVTKGCISSGYPEYPTRRNSGTRPKPESTFCCFYFVLLFLDGQWFNYCTEKTGG